MTLSGPSAASRLNINCETFFWIWYFGVCISEVFIFRSLSFRSLSFRSLSFRGLSWRHLFRIFHFPPQLSPHFFPVLPISYKLFHSMSSRCESGRGERRVSIEDFRIETYTFQILLWEPWPLKKYCSRSYYYNLYLSIQYLN